MESARSRTEQTSGSELADAKGSVRLGQYLHSLRTGYGYSLRKVEEKARVHGGEIDNSQLSRYEKGICYPSFDKLRTLARIFNVSIQTFSDVVDLEELEKNQPTISDPDELVKRGHEEFRLGDYGRAYAMFQRARHLLEEREDPAAVSPEGAREIARIRLATAIALYRLGKISLSEYEIRQLLRLERNIDPGTVVRALLQLSNVHATFGDFLLAEMEASHALAVASGLAEPILAIGISPAGIPFGGQRRLTDLFFLICSTDDRGHLRTLARLSRLVGSDDLLQALRQAEQHQHVYERAKNLRDCRAASGVDKTSGRTGRLPPGPRRNPHERLGRLLRRPD